MTSQGRIVATTVIGGYEDLSSQPVAQHSDLPFVCFTDDPGLTSDSWEVRVVQPRFPLDPVRSARHVKIRLSHYAQDVVESLWIDNAVTLLEAPELVLDDWLAGTDCTVPVHSFRESVLDEFAVVSGESLDDPARIYEQLAHYGATDADALREPVYWTGLMARRHTGTTEAAMAEWMDHVLRYSRRDQLSFNVAMRSAGLPVRGVRLDNHRSVHHRWPTSTRRLNDAERRRFVAAWAPPRLAEGAAGERSRALAVQVEELARQCADLREQATGMAESLIQRDDELSRAERELGALEALRVSAEARTASAEADASAARAQLEATTRALESLRNSRSVRWTRPLRTAVSRSRRGARP